MPVNPRTGQKYKISDNGRNRLHVYGTPGKKGVRKASPGYHVVKLARPKGFLYDPKNTQYYRNRETKGGLTAQRVYQNGRVVNMGAGSAFKKAGIPSGFYNQAVNTWNITNQPSIDTLSRNRDRERTAQNAAYGQIAGYYAGLGNTTKDLMGQAGQVGAQTDAQVQGIGQDRNAQIRQATPQYQGPLGEIAQRMANTEEQASLNRGASADAANRTYGVQTSGNRQALMGQVGAGQAIAGQERLSTLKGQGNQILQSYADKIADLEGQKPAKVLDTARQLQYDSQALDLKNADLLRKAQDDAASQKIAQQNADANTTRANKPSSSRSGSTKPGASPYGATAEANRTFRQKAQSGVELFRQAGISKKDPNALDDFYRFLVTKKNFSPVAAAIARSVYATGGLTPFAAKTMHQAGFSSGGTWGMRAPVR